MGKLIFITGTFTLAVGLGIYFLGGWTFVAASLLFPLLPIGLFLTVGLAFTDAVIDFGGNIVSSFDDAFNAA